MTKPTYQAINGKVLNTLTGGTHSWWVSSAIAIQVANDLNRSLFGK